LTLAAPDGQVRDVTIGLTDKPADTYRKGPGRARTIDGIEYLPILEMWGADASPSSFAAVRAGLERACRADGLVIDIRGNGGGTRDVLHLVASYLLPPDAEPVVYSAARALVWPGRDQAEVEEAFARRYLFMPEHDRWSERERRAIARFVEGFVPEVQLPAGRFGPLHVSVLSPGGEGGGRLAGTPVVVLMDERCASASDVFLAAMRCIPGVTLVGRPSSGASGMSAWHESPGVAIKLSTMVSFTSDGRVLDWHGVPPHVPIELTPGDFTRGGDDTALAQALELVRTQAARPEGR